MHDHDILAIAAVAIVACIAVSFVRAAARLDAATEAAATPPADPGWWVPTDAQMAPFEADLNHTRPVIDAPYDWREDGL